MKTEDLNYELPPELIAQQPGKMRSDSRLLVLSKSSGEITDSRFREIGNYLRKGDCLVLNDTKVLAARFFGRKSTGGKIEGLFLNEIKPASPAMRGEPGKWEVMLKGAQNVNTGEKIILEDRQKKDAFTVIMSEKKGQGSFYLDIESELQAEEILEKIGFPPLPPYIKRKRDIEQAQIDSIRYQTVYARQAGAVAAPTAGLHFTEELIEQLKKQGITFAYITLHVGAGTFKPVKTERLEEHRIHTERFEIDTDNAEIINSAKAAGGRIIAVGTTSVRTLETAAENSRVAACTGETDLFIMPGFKFKLVDAMVTNFHLPRSTLLALVAAFAGRERILAAYRHAIEQRYRFYSYGDAMLIC